MYISTYLISISGVQNYDEFKPEQLKIDIGDITNIKILSHVKGIWDVQERFN